MGWIGQATMRGQQQLLLGTSLCTQICAQVVLYSFLKNHLHACIHVSIFPQISDHLDVLWVWSRPAVAGCVCGGLGFLVTP